MAGGGQRRALTIIAMLVGAALPFVLDVVTVSSESMAPTLTAGQHVLAVRRSLCSLPFRDALCPPLHRGDLVVVRSPTQHGRALKRIIGVEGDKVRLTMGTLFLDDVPVFEPYANHANGYLRGQDSWPPSLGDSQPNLVVPPDNVVVMGDSRSQSEDSRYWGPLPTTAVVSTVFLVLP
jgi:signal peptidase I